MTALSSSLPQSLAKLVLDPPVHRSQGDAPLDRSLFTVNVPVWAASLPAEKTTAFMRGPAKDHVLRIPKAPTIVHDPEISSNRRILLPATERAQLSPDLLKIIEDANATLVEHSFTLDYDHWTADQLLQATLPVDLLDESPTSYTQVGHIAHLNLREEYLPHRHLIGQVILDKNKTLRTVVNKLDTIDNEFRNFRMEVLAGDEDFVVNLSESNCTFTFDFSLVYWNSRLQAEHLKLVESFDPNEVICDAFAGVGPFAVPAGKKGCGVLASDLNPASASALAINAKNNKVERNVRTDNADGRDFIRASVKSLWSNPFPAYTPPVSIKARNKAARAARTASPSSSAPTPAAAPPTVAESAPAPTPAGPARRLVDHFVMNLPALAIEFIDAYRGLYRELYKEEGFKEAVAAQPLPMVHCYCFTKDMEDQEGDILARATKFLGFPLTKDSKDCRVRFVRDVAPKKEMYCLSFRLTEEMVA